jgi:hypothetical protein
MVLHDCFYIYISSPLDLFSNFPVFHHCHCDCIQGLVDMVYTDWTSLTLFCCPGIMLLIFSSIAISYILEMTSQF